MGRKKQPFIQKKNAQHFHVVHRSQRDPRYNDPDASNFVLLQANAPAQDYPMDTKPPLDYNDSSDDDDDMPDLVEQEESMDTAAKSALPQLINEFGMLNDGYDYNQHLKSVGNGHFYTADGQFQNSSTDLLRKKVDLPSDILATGSMEQERMLESIALTTDLMEEDVREALVNDNAFEELQDDFIVQATEQTEDDGDNFFDYEEHIRQLMAACDGKPKFAGDLGDEDEEDYYYEEEHQDRPEDIALLDEHFDQIMHEYEDDCIGDLEDDDQIEETFGKLELTDDLVNEIADDFANMKQDILDDEGRVGNALRIGQNQLETFRRECEERMLMEKEDKPEYQQEEDEAEVTADKENESILPDHDYYKRKEAEQWDCESIVSTYSNLDNHPTLIGVSKKKKKRTKSANAFASAGTSVDQILLSNKSGMPLGIFEQVVEKLTQEELAAEEERKREKQQLIESVTRSRKETKEERKQRKSKVKGMKAKRREEKKQMKTLFKIEEQRQTVAPSVNVTTFKY